MACHPTGHLFFYKDLSEISATDAQLPGGGRCIAEVICSHCQHMGFGKARSGLSSCEGNNT